MFRFLAIVWVCFVVLVVAEFDNRSFAQSENVQPIVEQIQWEDLLASNDLVWDKLPRGWRQAPFLGNGEQGTMLYQLDGQTLRWDVGCSAAHEHRPFKDDDLSERGAPVYNRGRHFIGHIKVNLPTKLNGGTARLGLWDAEVTGTLASANGKASFAALAHATQPVMYFELEAWGDLSDASFEYVPVEARNPRSVRAKKLRKPANPPPVVKELADGVQTAVHNLHAGGQTAVAWIEKEVDSKRQLWLSVQHSFPELDAVTKAASAVREAAQADHDQWIAEHRQWWHDYYPASFLSTGDPFWDGFYWIQQYKLASATRDRGWIIDNQGPWLQRTAWNALWWNLNVQLSHSGFTTANRRELGTALSYRLDVLRDNLALNVAEPYRKDSSAIGRSSSGWDLLGRVGQPGGRPPMAPTNGAETGNLMWALHNVDLEHRYWNDTDLRDRVLYPLLVRAVNYYRHFLTEEADGLLHLPKTFSPEYRLAKDCTYDIDLLRWGVGRLLDFAAEKNLTEADEPLIAKWRDIQKRLVPVHIDKTGRMIGKGVALTGPHRHWSHLLAIYPLRTLTPESDADRKLILQCLNHWHGFKRGGAGYSKTGGSCIASLLGDGDRALELLNGLKSFLHQNTLYSEADALPVIETPLHGATAMQEMMFQSWNGRLRVFPAVPKTWSDVQFHQFRGEGAYLVSARREEGKTKWVSVEADAISVKGSIEVDPQLGDGQWAASQGVSVTDDGNGIFTVKMSPGDRVIFWPAEEPQPKVVVTPVEPRGKAHRFGSSAKVGR